jgi:hypothetical protein
MSVGFLIKKKKIKKTLNDLGKIAKSNAKASDNKIA